MLGTALAIKMVAYVLVAPLAGAYASRVSRRALLVALDIGRLVVVVLLPFVDEIWQIYVLIFLLQSCSAAFTPAFQATIPDILPAEKDYTKALSLSRLAYGLENLLSPALAALLLLIVGCETLFLGTALGFLGSALLVVSLSLPRAIGVFFAQYVWPKRDTEVLQHEHDDLPPDHAHLVAHTSGGRHEHPFVIDDLHARWPS